MTDADLLDAFSSIISGLSLPTSYPSIKFDPPDSGIWLEVLHQPNQPRQIGTRPGNGSQLQGLFTVIVHDRPGRGVFAAYAAVEQVKALFTRGTDISGAKVTDDAYAMPVTYEGADLQIPVTIRYTS